MKIISWNINGIRAARKKTFNDFIRQEQPDILCVQETKAQKKVLSPADYEITGYELFWAEGLKPGYSGVAIWVKQGIRVLSAKVGLGIEKFDNEGRTLLIELPEFYLINSYYPNGRDDLSRVDFKLEYSYKVLEWAQQLEKHKPVVLTGDFNTAHFAIDLARPKENEGNTGFLPIERKFLDQLHSANFIDVFRRLYPETKDIYSYWSYRGGAKPRNVGWRIDYFWVSSSFPWPFKQLRYHQPENSSDHCPVIFEF